MIKKIIYSFLILVMLAGITGAVYANEVQDKGENKIKDLTEQPGILLKHEQIEKDLLEWYESSDAKTLDTAIVQQNIYGTAPLTAVILFETENEEAVTVRVHGKTENRDIVYTTDSAKHHEVQIFGLYADYENTVTLTTESGQSREFKIETEPLPENLEQVTRIGEDAAPLGNHLFYVCDRWRLVFDEDGEVRWYMTELDTAFSGVDEMDPATHSFWFSTEGSSPKMATVYCMSFTGRVRGIFFLRGKSAHHDAALLPDGKLLYFSKWQTASAEVSVLDPEDGSITLYHEFLELFQEYPESLEYQTRDHEWDYTHVNAIQYIPENNSLLISFRNQHTIMDVDFDTKEINWVFTPSYIKDEDGTIKAIQSDFTDKLILPEDGDDTFEWFYSQHAVKKITYDVENQMVDLVLLDNGTDRFLATEAEQEDKNQEKYSRLVRYSLDLNHHTAKQIYTFGSDYAEYYSDQCGSAQYLPEEDLYIANFPGKEIEEDRTSVVTESDAEGNLISSFEIVNTTDGTYRCYVYDTDTFAETRNILSEPESYVEVYHLGGRTWEKSDFPSVKNGEKFRTGILQLTEKGFMLRGGCKEEENTAETETEENTEGTSKEEEKKEKEPHEFWLLATNEQGEEYSISLISFMYNHFYLPGIPMKDLPEGIWTLEIYSQIKGEPAGRQKLGYRYISGEKTETREVDSADVEVENTTIWKVEITESIAAPLLETVVPVIQYDGSIDDVKYESKAAEGNQFLLLNLKVEKDGKGSEAFSWENVFLEDAEGNKYSRMNDSFLIDHEYNRMAGTAIKMGKKNGWISFEIPSDTDPDQIFFIYESDKGSIRMKI